MIVTTKLRVLNIDVYIGADRLDQSKCIDYIGVKLDAHLTWKSQIDAVCKKLIFAMFRLSRLRPRTHWQFYPSREPFANGSRRVARVHTASTASGSSGTLRPHQDVFAVDANGSRRLVSAV